MKKVIYFLLPLAFLLTSCEKGKLASTEDFFTPSDHFINSKGTEVSFFISIPHKCESCFFYTNDTIDNACEEGSYFHECSIPLSEMNKLAQYFSDTNIFKWESQLLSYSYSSGNCMLEVFAKNSLTKINKKYVCNIGNDSTTIEILKELSKPLQGNPKMNFNEIIDVYENPGEKDTKYFNTDNFDSLNLKNIDGFWERDTIIKTSYSKLDSYGGWDYIDGINYQGRNKRVEISIYLTNCIAIDKMDETYGVAFQEISIDGVDYKCWKKIEYDNAICINVWNTLVYVELNDNENKEEIVMNTAIELANRVENLCEYNE